MKIFYCSGLPRSGSTLLLNLLGQNPDCYVTPTSGLIELFFSVKKNWKNHIEFKAEGLEKAKPRVLTALKGLLYGFFEKESGKTAVFDKSRGWLNYIEDLEEVFGEKVKLLVPIRDIRAICASFEKIYRKRGIEYDYPLGDGFFKCQTIEGRCEYLLSSGGIVGIAINRIMDAIQRGVKDRLIIVPYISLTQSPSETLDAIHEVLGLNKFKYDPDNVKQITFENDLWHGMDLHTINNKVKPKLEIPWKGILSDRYADELNKRYRVINEMAAGSFPEGF